MRTMARARFVRVSARKARLVLDQIRGKPVGEALATLAFTPRAAARLIEKVLRSAVANAEHNHQVRNLDDLRVVARGGRRRALAEARAAARDGPRVLHQASDEPSHDRGERRGQRRAVDACRAPRRAAAERAAPRAGDAAAPPARRRSRAPDRPRPPDV